MEQKGRVGVKNKPDLVTVGMKVSPCTHEIP